MPIPIIVAGIIALVGSAAGAIGKNNAAKRGVTAQQEANRQQQAAIDNAQFSLAVGGKRQQEYVFIGLFVLFVIVMVIVSIRKRE